MNTTTTTTTTAAASSTVTAAAAGAATGRAVARLAARIARVDQLIVRMVHHRAVLAAQLGAARLHGGAPEQDLNADAAAFHRYREGLGPDGSALALIVVHHQPLDQTELL